MSLITCKIHLELNWIKDCTLSSAGDSKKFKITDAKLHVPIVTLFTKDNVNLTKLLNYGFKRSAYWNSYQTISAKVIENDTNVHELLSASFQGVKSLFVLFYDITYDNKVGIKSNKKYSLPRAKMGNHNVLIDGGNVYDQPIIGLINQYDEEKYQQKKAMIILQDVY